MNTSAANRIIFTDLDGTLLDHYDNSFAPAESLLAELEDIGIPVIPTSSMTHAEIIELRTELANNHPFITENGAAVFIPQGYFPQQPHNTKIRGDFWVHEFSQPRQQWRTVLDQLGVNFPGCFRSFSDCSEQEIMAITGFGERHATLANIREYSEAIQWLGATTDKQQFITQLQEAGARAQQGARYLCIGGQCDKGMALLWLQDQYQRFSGDKIYHSLAVGDANNDIPMLLASDIALLIRSPAHDLPSLHRSGFTLVSEQQGPMGWDEGVRRWLDLELDSVPQTD